MKTTVLDSTSNNSIKSTEWIQMMSSSLLYHKNYLYTADRQIVALSLDLSTRYTGHILQGEGLCVSLSLEHSALHTANQTAKYLDYFIKIINSISFGKNLIYVESGPASAWQTLEHMLNNAEKPTPFSQKWIKSSRRRGADAIKPEPGFCGSRFGFFQSIRGPFCWTLSSIER